ncbi:aldehyde dehydrogenase family protein [Nocardia sp. NPDC050713]|uniref:aldehyde dehydrogenase family protein n=1 Tax=Nocardia sp. NPDC050713 TaxID=3154511 RepID=UPI0033FD2FAD
MSRHSQTSTVRHYIEGQWSDADGSDFAELTNPATGEVSGLLQLGTQSDVDRAVEAAQRAFISYSSTSLDERVDLLRAVIAEIEKRGDDLAEAVTTDMGMPIELSKLVIGSAVQSFQVLVDELPSYPFEKRHGDYLVVREPIGVAALIPPWNYPSRQIAGKVAPAIAVGCTAVLKPAELAAHSGAVFAEIFHGAGVPAGVVNVVNGFGSVVGSALSRHNHIDVVSFTGSTAVGVQVQRDAADTVKRVSQELGGKSAHIVLPDADFEAAVKTSVDGVMRNSGQTCYAPTRTIIPRAERDRFVELVRKAVDAITVGAPSSPVAMGPVASEKQWQTVQRYIETGIREGATLVVGGTGRPEGLPDRGWFVRPTVFADVSNDMTIAREEIFGPVMSIIGYDTIEEAIDIANDTPYGLAAFVDGADVEKAKQVARRIRAGQVSVNTSALNPNAPFGGYKRSGNGRAWGIWAIEEFLETKALVGAV